MEDDKPSGQFPGSKLRRETMSAIEDSNRVQIDFLKTELDVATAFANRALATNDSDTRERNRSNARQGYETIIHGLERVSVQAPDAQTFTNGLERLRTLLRDIGEKL